MTKNAQNDKVNAQGGTVINTLDTEEGRISELHKRFGTTDETVVEESPEEEGGEKRVVHILKNSDGVEIARGTVEELEEQSRQPDEKPADEEKDAE